MTKTHPKPKIELSPEEEKLIDYIRKLGWGEFWVKVKAGKPVMIQQPLQNVNLEV
ncbi:MAG: hypothetical protein K6U74_02170 [Firmicutes bacterium]|nr:hypothetical protein [Bacillota bacterium]